MRMNSLYERTFVCVNLHEIVSCVPGCQKTEREREREERERERERERGERERERERDLI